MHQRPTEKQCTPDPHASPASSRFSQTPGLAGRFMRVFRNYTENWTRADRARSIGAMVWRTKIGWLPLLAAITMFSVDRVIAEHQRRMFRVSVNRHVMAALQDEADEALDQTLRSHWIATNEDGDLEGRISAIDPESADSLPIEKLSVALLEHGKKIRKAKTDEKGRFVLEDVPKGVFTLVASGKTGFLAYGVHVLPDLEELDLDEFDFDARRLTPSQRQAFYVSYFKLPQEAVVKEELQIDAAAVPPQFSTLRKISQNYLSAASALSVTAGIDDLKAIGKATIIRGGFEFPLSPEGHFLGRVQPIETEDGRPARLTEMNLFLIQDDVEIARVAAKENGEFKIENVDPGVYALLAAGKDGFAALSLELVVAEAEEDEIDEGVGQAAPRVDAIYVSTEGPQPDAEKAKIPRFGIACIRDPADIRALQQEIKEISGGEDFVDYLDDSFVDYVEGDYAPSSGVSGGQFPGSQFGGVPTSPGSFVPQGFSGGLPPGSGLRPLAGPGGLGLIGLVGGAIAIIDLAEDGPVNDGQTPDPLPVSSNRPPVEQLPLPVVIESPAS